MQTSLVYLGLATEGVLKDQLWTFSSMSSCPGIQVESSYKETMDNMLDLWSLIGFQTLPLFAMIKRSETFYIDFWPFSKSLIDLGKFFDQVQQD